MVLPLASERYDRVVIIIIIVIIVIRVVTFNFHILYPWYKMCFTITHEDEIIMTSAFSYVSILNVLNKFPVVVDMAQV